MSLSDQLQQIRKTAKMGQKKFRRLKIQPKFISRVYDEVFVPEIRFSGKWLQESGFDFDKHILIQQEKNKLTITLDEGTINK